MTAAGRVTAGRRSMRCGRCGATAYPADARIGLGDFLSPGAVRMACRAAAGRSFEDSSALLEELAGLRVDGETIRRRVHAAAGRIAAGRDRSPTPELAGAGGDVELLVDGVMAPTRSGWRELKLARFQVRPRGEPAGAAEWATRRLPPPSASAAYASLADAGRFAARWRAWAEGLGVEPDGALTALGDGAAWIWAAVAEHFPTAAGVLDILHAAEHLAAAADGLFGEGTAEAADWRQRGRAALLADGWPGLLDHVGATPTSGRTASGQEALDKMLAYFAAHTDRLGYFGRLRSGRSIGSGAVEGLARRMGRRLKVPGRGWDAVNVDGMAALVATVGTPEWDGLWTRPAA